MATHSTILYQRFPMDRGAWRAIVHGVTKSRTLLSDLAQHTAVRYRVGALTCRRSCPRPRRATARHGPWIWGDLWTRRLSRAAREDRGSRGQPAEPKQGNVPGPESPKSWVVMLKGAG